MHRGARPDRSKPIARGLAKSFFKLKTMPTNCPKTSLDELDKVEIHLNQSSAFSEWLGIRVYEPERGKDAEVVWHLRKNPAAQLKNILIIGVFERHAFVIRILQGWRKRMHVPIATQDSQRPATFNVMPKGVPKEKQ